jgi:hypothetical protein
MKFYLNIGVMSQPLSYLQVHVALKTSAWGLSQRVLLWVELCFSHQKGYVEVLTPAPPNVTLIGNRTLIEESI